MRIRLPEPAPFPWRRPRRETLLIALVAVAALSQVYPPNAQDVSRICLSKALVAGRLTVDSCIGTTVDRALYHGHLYSNKAPGMSVVELPAVEAARVPEPRHWALKGDLRIWAVHLFASGLPFLLCVFLVGRISEGLAPGVGGAALVTFGLGTMAGPLAAAGFDHDVAAGFGFLAFVLAWRRRPLLSGLAAGAALTTEYQAAAILVILLAYVALEGRRAALTYVAAALPGVVLLGAYNWAAFGAPWHNPLRYSDNPYAADERSGLLGIHLPRAHATRLVFVGERGLLITSPVLVAAVVGLVLLWRRGLRAETLVCAAVAVVFLIAECGYFIPYGGASPGPRFFAPALPFLALGLGPAFARQRVATIVLAALSVVATTAVMLTWFDSVPYRQTIWGEIARIVPQHGAARLANEITKNILVWGPNRILAAAVVVLVAIAAFVISLLPETSALPRLLRR